MIFVRAGRKVATALRVWWFRLLYPDLKLGRQVRLGRGVRILIRRNGRILIGDRTTIEANCLIASGGIVHIGADSFVGQGTVIAARESVTIGPDALIAANVTIRDQDHGTGAKPYRAQPYVTKPISIGSNVWLGAGAVVLKGVSIGDDAIIGANAVVTKPVAPGSRVVGIPATVRK